MSEITIPTKTSTVFPDRSLFGTQNYANISRYYSLFLLDVTDGTVPVEAWNPGPGDASQPLEFIFTVPPKAHEMLEPFAVNVAPTQNGGKYVEPMGSVLKEVRLSGNFGLRARAANPEDGIRYSEEEVTGQDLLNRLKNFFRAYSDIVMHGNANIIMIWRNIKDGEYWIVEPTNISLMNEAGTASSISANYSITLRCIAPYVPQAIALEDAAPSQPLEQAARDIAESAMITMDDLAMVEAAKAVVEEQKQAEGTTKIRSTLRYGNLTPIADYTNKGMQYVRPYTSALLGMAAAPQAVFRDVLSALKAVEDGTLGAAEKVVLKALNLAHVASAAKYDLSRGAVIDSRVARVRNAWKRAEIASKHIISTPVTSSSDGRYLAVRNRIARAYDRGRSRPRTVGSKSYLGNVDPVTTVSEDVVRQGDTIRSVAERLLGNSQNWKDIVLLNELVPPYISQVKRPGVLVPGDKILYPQSKAAPPPELTHAVHGQDDPEFLSEAAYGRDIRLTSHLDADHGVERVDADIDERGDLATITGVPNVHQAIRIKFSTERGQLKSHPFFGARFPKGRKGDLRTFDEFRINTIATLLSDPRIENVKNLVITTTGDILHVFADLKVTDANDYVNTSFAVRR